MGKIVAVGGGEMGRPRDVGGFYPIETIPIDREILRLTGKKHPKLLFLPTASNDSAGYYEVIKKYFGERLGCEIDVLYLKKERYSPTDIRKRVLNSDIVYVGGGNTLNMLNVWRKKGLDRALKEAYDKGIILSGVSAGANCWFRHSSSDSRPKLGKKMHNYGYIRVNGINLVNLTISPHDSREPKRTKALIKIMRRTPGVGIALTDCAALEIVDGTYRIITSKPQAEAHRVFWKKGKLERQKIPKKSDFQPLETLLET